jgi:hypothetical protein
LVVVVLLALGKGRVGRVGGRGRRRRGRGEAGMGGLALLGIGDCVGLGIGWDGNDGDTIREGKGRGGE